MRVGKWIAIGLLALPLAELIVFVAVAAGIGWISALALLIATSFLGVSLLRRLGQGHAGGMRGAVSDLGPRLQTGADAFAALGAILLVVPGFITDVLGLLLLLPQVRRGIGATIRRAMQAGPAKPGRSGTSGSVVDLDPDEWRQVPEAELPRRKRGDS